MQSQLQAAAVAFQPQPSDILIAVMGITGSGKSTFISYCTNETVSVGSGLHSHTQAIAAYPCKPEIGKNVYLIDTPGFDDTERDDAEILKEIAAWVSDTYERKVYLRGMLYLHCITDVRMQRVAMKNLFMFKKLCGQNALKNVVLVTTMWNEVQARTGEQREKELQTTPDYWGEMISKGSRMARYQNDYKSARDIILSLLGRTTQTTLAIQKEMVDEGLDLNKTSAGKELNGILTLERERFSRHIKQLKQDMAEARALQDRESQEQIRLMQQQRQAEIEKLVQQQESIKVSLERLHEERFAKLERLLTTQQSQMERDKLEITELRERLANASIKTGLGLNQNTLGNTMGSNTMDNTAAVSADRPYHCIQTLNNGNEVLSVVFSPDGRHLASGSLDGIVKIWDIKRGKCLHTFAGRGYTPTYEPHKIAYSPDGRHITSGALNKTIKIWDSTTGSCLRTVQGHTDRITSLKYSPDGHCIASCSPADRCIKIWNSTTGICLRSLETDHEHPNCIDFSPDGHRIAMGSAHGSLELNGSPIRIWDVVTGSLAQTLKHFDGQVHTVAFSQNGRRIASGSSNGTVNVWDSMTGNCLQTLQHQGHVHPSMRDANVFSVAFSPDGRRLVSGSIDKTIKIWDSATAKCLQTLKQRSHGVVSIAISPLDLDGYFIASSSGPEIKIWGMMPKMNSSSGSCTLIYDGRALANN